MTKDQYKQFVSDVAEAVAKNAEGFDREAFRVALDFPATREAFWDIVNPNAAAADVEKILARTDGAVDQLEQHRRERGMPPVFARS